MIRLILIRHGETDYNSQNKYCGFSNPFLNKTGIKQSERLAEKCSTIKVDKVYSSDLNRAVETANIVFKDHLIQRLNDFREINFGCFEGLGYNDILKKYPDVCRNWIDNPMNTKIPEAESFSIMRQRVKKKLGLIFSQNKNKTVALVSHGGPIKVILCEALNYSMQMFLKIKQDNGALNIVDYHDKLAPSVILFNDTH